MAGDVRKRRFASLGDYAERIVLRFHCGGGWFYRFDLEPDVRNIPWYTWVTNY